MGLARLATLILGSVDDAEELVDEAFARYLRYGQAVDNPAAYLRTTLVRLCSQTGLRRDADRGLEGLLPTSVTPAPDPDRLILVQALGQLRIEQRAVVVLRYWADLSHADIAVCLGVPEATVRSRLHRAMRRLRDALGDSDDDGARR